MAANFGHGTGKAVLACNVLFRSRVTVTSQGMVVVEDLVDLHDVCFLDC